MFGKIRDGSMSGFKVGRARLYTLTPRPLYLCADESVRKCGQLLKKPTAFYLRLTCTLTELPITKWDCNY
jgi:hypothetical protein